jgi:hypothetical protein
MTGGPEKDRCCTEMEGESLQRASGYHEVRRSRLYDEIRIGGPEKDRCYTEMEGASLQRVSGYHEAAGCKQKLIV